MLILSCFATFDLIQLRQVTVILGFPINTSKMKLSRPPGKPVNKTCVTWAVQMVVRLQYSLSRASSGNRTEFSSSRPSRTLSPRLGLLRRS